jgi:single-strand DNA-binding protein
MPDLKMPQINQVTVAGRLVRDPELRYTETKKAVCSFGIAVDTGPKDTKQTFWGKVQCWEKVAEYVGQYLTKGRPVVVTGRLTTEDWTDKTGNKRQTTVIVANSVQALDWQGDGTTEKPAYPHATTQARPPATTQKPKPVEAAQGNLDDDLPF